MIAQETIKTGELAGVVEATKLPNIACNLVKFKAAATNAGNVYLGGVDVTKSNGNTNETTGFELAPGDETGWLPIANLNKLYRICDNVGDDLIYLALA